MFINIVYPHIYLEVKNYGRSFDDIDANDGVQFSISGNSHKLIKLLNITMLSK
jgi:hypothetical protein